MKERRSKEKKGFTLIEVMIAVVIVAILTTVVTPQFHSLVMKAKESKLMESLSTIRSAVDVEYAKANGRYPEEIGVQMFKEGRIPEDPVKETSQVFYNYDEEIIIMSTDGGWVYNPTKGEVRVNNTDEDLAGTPYSEY
ncbi:type II secretion system pseudopilin OxpG [Propionigenium maris DSM 9537]|uniref:Type II secretion system pseudopilin OxpG n=1 Tax=Propionigenium maris DSM 9537 TaxID=1123000 RepID=A0A9W6GPI3_9FUSO|nr:type II secretion system protein [Propionigenium maris]GLI57546.1 type II secretion system pseudopilin OxpG [Propionigenium maris DSM 9537]